MARDGTQVFKAFSTAGFRGVLGDKDEMTSHRVLFAIGGLLT